VVYLSFAAMEEDLKPSKL